MARPNPLTQGLNQQSRRAEPAAAAPVAVADQTTPSKGVPPSRVGRVLIGGHFAPEVQTALKIVADVADATATVDLHPERIVPVLPQWEGRPYLHHPDGGLLTPRTLEVEREIIEVRYELARQYARLNHLNRVVVDPPGAWIGLVSSGITYREVREALARLGLESDAQIAACGIRLLKMNMPMPFEPELVRDFAKGLAEVFVLEEKRPGLEALVKEALYPLAVRPVVVGRFDEAGAHLVPGHGALDADLLIPALRRRLAPRLADRLAPPRRSVGLEVVALPVARKPFLNSSMLNEWVSASTACLVVV